MQQYLHVIIRLLSAVENLLASTHQQRWIVTIVLTLHTLHHNTGVHLKNTIVKVCFDSVRHRLFTAISGKICTSKVRSKHSETPHNWRVINGLDS